MKEKMRNFKYGIGVDENNTPYIILPENYEDNTGDKFMVVSLCAAILNRAFESLDIEEINEHITDDDSLYSNLEELENAIEYLSGVAHGIGQLLINEKKDNTNITDITEIIDFESIDDEWFDNTSTDDDFNEKKFHVIVKNIAERNELPNVNIIVGDNIYKRVEGLRVYVKTTKKIYELQGGITNKHWKIIG